MAANILSANLSCTSNRTGELANYTLSVEPMLRTGLLSVSIPSYISGLFDNGTPTVMTDDTFHSNLRVEVNGVAVLITGTDRDGIGSVNGLYKLTYQTGIYNINLPFNQISTTSRNLITLVLRNVVNPPDNRPLGFTLVQHEVEVGLTQIYGHQQLSYRMTKLNPVTVYSGVRNMTKIGANISLTLDIETATTQSDSMLIKLSTMQVLVREGEGYTCLVCFDETDCDMNGISITSVQAENTIKISNHKPGRHKYTISGCLINSYFSQVPQVGDEIYVGLSSPYQTAETTQ